MENVVDNTLPYERTILLEWLPHSPLYTKIAGWSVANIRNIR